MTDEWTEAGYCVMGSSLAFLLFAVPKIMGALIC